MQRPLPLRPKRVARPKKTVRRKRPKGRGLAAPPRSARRIRQPVKRLSARATDGCVLEIAVVERQGSRGDVVQSVIVAETADSSHSIRGSARRREGNRFRRQPLVLDEKTARTLAALGHPQRLKLLAALLKGPAIYRALARATELKVGPLYHHINQLRLTGLILPKERNLYELTKAGRSVAMLAGAIGVLGKHGRLRRVH